MVKLFVALAIAAALSTGLFLTNTTTEEKTSLPLNEGLLDALLKSEHELIDLKKNHLLGTGGWPAQRSDGAVTDIQGDNLAKGSLVEVTTGNNQSADPRITLLLGVRKLIKTAQDMGFGIRKGGVHCYSFGAGGQSSSGSLQVSYSIDSPSSNSSGTFPFEAEDRFIAVNLNLVQVDNPSMALGWELILDTKEKTLTLRRWLQGRHPIRYSSQNWNPGSLSLDWKASATEK